MRKSLIRFLSLACVIIMLTPMLVACDADSAAKKTEASLNVIVPDAPKAVVAGDPVKTTCAPCHQNMVADIDSDSHAVHDCAQCHTPGGHPTNPTAVKPVTNLTPELCGGCHTDQYCSFMTINLNSPARKEKATPEGISPAMDKLLAGHGFTVEHNEPRSHAFMLIDQTVVDRAYGGRFTLKSWQDVLSTGPIWSIIEDNGADYTAAGTARAANPVCISCKTSESILEWAYLGEENAKADWARTSNGADYVKSLNNPCMSCTMCHDPHTTEHRIIRDALIQATDNNGTFPYMADGGASLAEIEIVTLRGFRKIALLDKPVSNVLCAQCHVEYSCNPGINPETGEKIAMTDTRTNQFPWVNIFDLEAYYDELQFADFTHAITGARLVKIQHPDAETNFGGTHQTAGVECADCHMPVMKNDNGESYTSHWQASPRNFLDETCLKCHTGWTAGEAEYRIDTIQNYTEGKVRNAEYWLERLIDTFAAAKVAGVSEEVLAEARGYHQTAHIYWEWWTAENSGGFHNPDMAQKSLVLSVEAARQGIAALEKAMMP